MKTALHYITTLALFIVLVDFFGFIAWATSGQYPQDGFFVGTLTAHVIKAVISL